MSFVEIALRGVAKRRVALRGVAWRDGAERRDASLIKWCMCHLSYPLRGVA